MLLIADTRRVEADLDTGSGGVPLWRTVTAVGVRCGPPGTGC